MSLQERDSKYLWHPYTQHKTAAPPIAIVKGEGALVWDENGKQYIDAIASWWVNPYGHSNKYIADAIYRQLTSLEHVLFWGLYPRAGSSACRKANGNTPCKPKETLFFRQWLHSGRNSPESGATVLL